MFMLSFQCFLSIILCQCSSAIYTALLQSLLHPLWSPFACLLACFLIHSLSASYFSPSFHEWVVGEILPLCVLSPWLQHWWGAPQECSIMWHSLVCARPHHSFLTWVGVLSSWFFFSPRRWERTKENGLDCHQGEKEPKRMDWIATKFKAVTKYCFKPWSRVGPHCSLH
jgi:hypothetical protein